MKGWTRNLLWVLGTLALLYAMVYADVVLRARSSYLKGEQYWRWAEHPEEKKAALEADFERDKAKLDRELARNEIVQDDHDRRVEILQSDLRHGLSESSLKYAYVWYKTAYELFSPPESKWVRLARRKAPLAREKWKEELRSKKIPFEDYMLD